MNNDINNKTENVFSFITCAKSDQGYRASGRSKHLRGVAVTQGYLMEQISLLILSKCGGRQLPPCPPSSAGPDFYDVDKGHEIQWTSMPLEPFLGLCGPIISRA